MATWIKNGFPKFSNQFEEQYTSFDYIIGEEYKVTFRQGKKLNSSSQFEKKFQRLDKEEDLEVKTAPTERTEQIIGAVTGTKYNYTSDDGYQDKGGYVLLWPKNVSNLFTAAKNFVSDGIIGPDTWIFAIEFINYESLSRVYQYNAITITILQSGKIERRLSCVPLFLRQYTKQGLSVFRAMCECVYVILLIFYFAKFVRNLFLKNEEYSNWHENEILFFSSLQRYQRVQKEPEYWRKIKYVFSIFTLIEFIGYIFAIISIIYWILFSVYSQETHDSPRDLKLPE